MKARFFVMILFVAGCAAVDDPVLKEARELVAAGRGEQALALLMKDSKYQPEYYRTRELLAAQWLAQAETLRVNAQPEAAAELLRRVQKYDAGNPRARAGLEQLEVDARHRPIIGNAERLVKEESYLDAQDLLRPVLIENPQSREARRL